MIIANKFDFLQEFSLILRCGEHTRLSRITYLVTYSQANLAKSPTRKRFGKCSIKKTFNASRGKVKVTHWACYLENHKDGGQHYHVALKLSGPKRWITV